MRGKKAQKRTLEPDVVYKSRLVSRMINYLMLSGKKTTSESAVYYCLQNLNEDQKMALDMFETAVKNVMPKQEVRSKRVGGATYQVPMPVKHTRAEALALRWIIQAARKVKGKPIHTKLFLEVKNAYENQGSAVRKRDEVHKMAESNRAFAHFGF